MSLVISFFTRELHINNTLCRNFFWFESNLWAEETNERTTVFLGGSDSIVPSEAVRDYMRGRSQARVVLRDGYHHAQVLIMPWAIRDLVNAM